MIPNSVTKIIFFDGYFVKMSLALFGNSQAFLVFLGSALLVFFFFDLFGIPVQFLYRYLVLNRNVSFNFPRYALMLAVPIMASIINAVVFCILDTEGSMEMDATVQALLNDYIDLRYSVYVTLVTNRLNIILFFTIYCMCMIICYIVNIFCAIKMVAFVTSHADFNPRMKELNRQLTKNLIILAIFPLAFCCCSLLYTVLYYFANPHFSLHVEFFYTIMAPWITIINPLVTIWINLPYRNAIKKFIFIVLKKNFENSVHSNPPIVQ